MKKSILKAITAFLLTVCLAGTLFISVACSDNNQGDNTTVSSSSPASTDSGSQSGSASGGNPSDPTKDPVNEPKAVERDGISVQKLLGDVMDMSVYDCFELLSGNDLSVLDGLLVGDVVNLVISSIQLEVPGANVSALGYALYDDGFWYAKHNGKKLHFVVNALFNYKLDGSEPIALTESDIETYGDTSVLELSGLKGNYVISSFIDTDPVVSAVVNAKLNSLLGLFSNDNAEVLSSVDDIFGDFEIGDIAALLGKEIDDATAEIALSELIDKYGYILTAETEEELKDDLYALAMTELTDYIKEHGEDVVFGDVTVSDLATAASDPQGEKAQAVISAFVKYACEYICDNYDVEDISETIFSYYEEYKDVVIYDEYTFAQLFDAAKNSGDPQEIIDVIFEEIAKIEESEEYAEKVLAPIYALIDSAESKINDEYGDIAVTEDLSLSEALEILKENEREEIENTLNDLAVVAAEYLYGYAVEAGLDELFNIYYPQVKDVTIYGDKTIENIVEGAKDLTATEAFAVVMAEINKISDDEDYAYATLLPFVGGVATIAAPYAEETVISVPFKYTVSDLLSDVIVTAMTKGESFMPLFVGYALNVSVEDVAALSENETSDIPVQSISDLIDAINGLTLSEVFSGGFIDVLIEYSEIIKISDIFAASDSFEAFIG